MRPSRSGSESRRRRFWRSAQKPLDHLNGLLKGFDGTPEYAGRRALEKPAKYVALLRGRVAHALRWALQNIFQHLGGQTLVGEFELRNGPFLQLVPQLL